MRRKVQGLMFNQCEVMSVGIWPLEVEDSIDFDNL